MVLLILDQIVSSLYFQKYKHKVNKFQVTSSAISFSFVEGDHFSPLLRLPHFEVHTLG